MNLMEIAKHFEASNLGTIGTDIFIGEIPYETVSGILLIDTYAGSRIDHELPGWRDTGFRMVIRSLDYESGQVRASTLSSALTIRSDTVLGSILMRQSLPVNDPLPYRRSAGSKVWEFEVDVECVYIQR